MWLFLLLSLLLLSFFLQVQRFAAIVLLWLEIIIRMPK